VECKQCSSNNWLLIILYLMVYCAIGCYLLYTLKSTVKTAVADSQTIITKCLAYCYQTIPLLVQADSVTVVLQPLLSIFALKTSNGDSGGMCFIEGMDAMGKLLVPLVGPLFLVAVVFVLLLVAILRAQQAQVQEATNKQDSDEGEPLPRIVALLVASDQLLWQEHSGNQEYDDVAPDEPVASKIWKDMMWLVLLFVYSPVSLVALQLLDCRKIGEHYLAYYATEYHCFSSYHGLQYLLFVLVLCVVLFPGLVVLDIWNHRRAGTDTKLTYPFKEDFWWWEGMLMGRRLVLIVLSVLPISITVRQALLTCACIMVLSLQVHCWPFHSQSVNICESTVLFCLALISVLTMLQHQVRS
jgi:hypothetical protein